MRQALGPGALGRPRGSGWRGRWEGEIGMGDRDVWQNSLQKKKKKKSKWLSKKALQRAEKRRELNCKGERERYTQLNADFQGTAWRDKKKSFFLSEQFKEIEESPEWERLEISLRKLRDTRGTFHAKKGIIRDRNSKGLREAEEIKKRWRKRKKRRRGGENTQNNKKKKGVKNPDNQMVWSFT